MNIQDGSGLRTLQDRGLRKHLARFALLVILGALSGITLTVIWNAHGGAGVEDLHFSISCEAASQRKFEFATALLHSLRFDEAERSYLEITRDEPDCAMAYWGIAMSRVKRPIPGTRAPYDIRVAHEALRSAEKARIATSRERAYIDALSLLFADGDAPDWDHRTIAYEQAMEQLALRETDDEEATVFYALALNMVPPALDPDFQARSKAIEILLAALTKEPNHPGLLHYLTYCTRVTAGEIPPVPAVRQDHIVRSIQSALAVAALLGVSAFFIAVLPVWSRAPRSQ
jgi:hypothetical protein